MDDRIEKLIQEELRKSLERITKMYPNYTIDASFNIKKMKNLN